MSGSEPHADVLRFHDLIEKADLAAIRAAIAAGADVNAGGHVGQVALMVAIYAKSAEAVQVLLDAGADPELTDDFNGTPLAAAVNSDFVEGARMLLALGVDRGHTPKYPLKKLDYRQFSSGADEVDEAMREFYEHPTVDPLIGDVQSVEMLKLFLAAGEDLNRAPSDVKRAYLGLATPEEPVFSATPEEYKSSKSRIFGGANPERMDVPFWHDMIRNGCIGYVARTHFNDTNIYDGTGPTWCFERFGSTITPLPDGRFVQIAGEHEDHYDPDFCIYNDVVVHDGQGHFALFGYPRDVFPPTDFHTATLVGDWIYIVGCLGYYGERDLRVTPVYRLHVGHWHIEEVETHGDMPNRLHDHRAYLDEERQVLRLEGGDLERVVGKDDSEIVPNESVWALSLETFDWVRV